MAAPRLLSVVFECSDADALGRFYEQLLGWQRHHGDDEWVTIADPADTTHRISFQQVADHVPPTWPARDRPQQAHLDLLVDDLEQAVEHALTIGAERRSANTVVHEDESFVVFADPAGHPFCLIQQVAPDL